MKTILLIEDDANIRENTAEILALANYNVLTAPDGKKGVEMAEQQHTDLIISDINMPLMDGFEVVKALRKSLKNEWTPFIFLSANNNADDKKRGHDLGALAYLTKPISIIELLRVVTAILA